MCIQDAQLVVYGGEAAPEADENEAGNACDEGNEVFNDLSIMEPDMRDWLSVQITGKQSHFHSMLHCICTYTSWMYNQGLRMPLDCR